MKPIEAMRPQEPQIIQSMAELVACLSAKPYLRWTVLHEGRFTVIEQISKTRGIVAGHIAERSEASSYMDGLIVGFDAGTLSEIEPLDMYARGQVVYRVLDR